MRNKKIISLILAVVMLFGVVGVVGATGSAIEEGNKIVQADYEYGAYRSVYATGYNFTFSPRPTLDGFEMTSFISIQSFGFGKNDYILTPSDLILAPVYTHNETEYVLVEYATATANLDWIFPWGGPTTQVGDAVLVPLDEVNFTELGGHYSIGKPNGFNGEYEKHFIRNFVAHNTAHLLD